jgi:hypothetical protein
VAETLRKGTVEWLIYDVTDKLGNLNDLAGTNARYDVYDPTGTKIVTQTSLSTDGMQAYALMDTTGSNFVPNSLPYRVYLQFDTGPESPYLFGGDFILIAVPEP